MLDNVREDYRTHAGLCPGFFALLVFRFGAWRYGLHLKLLRAPCTLLYRSAYAIVRMCTGIELPCETRIGRRFKIEHHSDIIINGNAQFGDDVIVRNGVTVGVRRTNELGFPIIGSRVDIGAGAKILGAIRIGDDVVIGANAVVLTDVPSQSLAVGVPASILPRRDRQVASAAAEPEQSPRIAPS
jgi:serine O-acetyltransferase